jgi:ribosomal protein S18 acetylase RimI-like enzyme
MTAAPSPARMLAAMDATWPAPESARFGAWIVRRGFGGGSRVSAIRPLGDPGMDLSAAVDAAAAIQRGWGQTPLAQIGPDDATLDALLAARDWAEEDHTVLLAAPVATLAERPEARLMAVRVRAPLAALDELWAAGGIGPARRAVMDAAPAPKDALMLRFDDRAAAALFVAAHCDAAMLHALHVAPAFRRRGVGRAAALAAADWAAEHGCAWLGLGVTSRNVAARALYAGLGFAEVCGYRYRRAP